MSSARGQRVAAYLTSYLIKGEGIKASVQETVTATDAPSRTVYVARSLTTVTGVTMRHLRRVRYVYMMVKTGIARVVDDLVVDVATGEIVGVAHVVLQT
jgi:hypothetical protein